MILAILLICILIIFSFGEVAALNDGILDRLGKSRGIRQNYYIFGGSLLFVFAGIASLDAIAPPPAFPWLAALSVLLSIPITRLTWNYRIKDIFEDSRIMTRVELVEGNFQFIYHSTLTPYLPVDNFETAVAGYLNDHEESGLYYVNQTDNPSERYAARFYWNKLTNEFISLNDELYQCWDSETNTLNKSDSDVRGIAGVNGENQALYQSESNAINKVDED